MRNDGVPAPGGEAEVGDSYPFANAAPVGIPGGLALRPAAPLLAVLRSGRDLFRTERTAARCQPTYTRGATVRRLLAGAVVALALPSAAAGQPVPIPEVVAETPAIRPTIPAPAASVGTSSARTTGPAAAGAVKASEALVRTG